MSRILVLGGAGAMGSVAVRDLMERTDHRVVVGELRTEEAEAMAGALGPRLSVRSVDVEDGDSLAGAISECDVVLSATFMRHNVRVTRAAIAAGVHLVDLGAYVWDTRDQLELDDEARAAGSRIVPGCGVAPGLTNVLARDGAERFGAVRAIRIYSYITHPMTTSPGIVYTRFDASRGSSLVLRDGVSEERPSFSEEELVEFPPPYGPQLVHLVPHPEPLTLPRYLHVRDVVFKVGYPPDETTRLRSLLELDLDAAEPFGFGGAEIVPRDFVAAFVGRQGLAGLRTANVKRVILEGEREGRAATLTYDLAVEREGESASSAITGTVAAIAADLVANGGGRVGVHPPEGAFDPAAVLCALRLRGFEIRESWS